jgi:hypothetical protein
VTNKRSVTIKIESCTQCPHVEKTYTGKGNHTFACLHKATESYWVASGYRRGDGSSGRLISQECERPSEFPQYIPTWCPLLKPGVAKRTLKPGR